MSRESHDSESGEIAPGVYYGGRGLGGEYYFKNEYDVDSLWVHNGTTQVWTPEELEAIAADMRRRRRERL